MNNETNTPLPEATRTPENKFNHVWWIPFIAFLVAAFLVVSHFTSQGPLITIQFDNAEGISVENTKLKYKSVTIGQVEKITLDESLDNVLVYIRLQKGSENLIRKDSQFWIVKPRIEVTKISGLNTLLSGAYITIDPAKDQNQDYQYHFVGLSDPPITTQDKPGLRLTLLAEKSTAFYPGSAVYYKGMPVGNIERVYFSDDYLWVKVDVFINAPHHQLIRQNSKFWSAGGISVKTSANGIDVALESIEALVAGGIAFETPIELLLNDEAVTSHTEFFLYPNKTIAYEQQFGKKQLFVSYFESNISGLSTDAQVLMNGITVGKVKAIQLMFDPISGKTYTPVLYEIYEDRITVLNSSHDTSHNTANDTSNRTTAASLTNQLIQSGLHARLVTANLLTGSKNITLAMSDNIIPLPLQLATVDDLTGYPILPTQPESLETITDSIATFVDKINQMPINELVTSANQLLNNADTTLTQLNLQPTLDAFNALLKDGQQLSQASHQSIQQLTKSIETLVKQTESVIAGYSPDAPLYHGLTDTLGELNDTLSSLKILSEMLTRSPDALIFGENRRQQSEQPQQQATERQHGDQ
ncbi:PqiB family protein [Ostreibacterium oceani]|uniref:MCE family protein n=1 Tax=Ostreibacterium oceani TaxID=2654998 RepID=A0A6N7ERQ3_9GAMM|nr:MlaD family protein [Ostreibacterium oceani]MPV85221.1 MCE family protein [Ostreibacterium oceani]